MPIAIRRKLNGFTNYSQPPKRDKVLENLQTVQKGERSNTDMIGEPKTRIRVSSFIKRRKRAAARDLAKGESIITENELYMFPQGVIRR